MGLLFLLSDIRYVKEHAVGTRSARPSSDKNAKAASTSAASPEAAERDGEMAATSAAAAASTLGEAMAARLDWKVYDSSVEARDDEAIMAFARGVFHLAFSFATAEPRAPVNVTCRAPGLPAPRPAADQDEDEGTTRGTPPAASLFCSPSVSSAFNGSVRSAPRKVGHAIQLGFDVDTLEILLHELIDVVDRFFVVEWTMPHNQNLNPKPLTWEAVKHQARFAFARDKVVHVLLDDVDAAYTDAGMWSVERRQERRRYERIVEWNEQAKFFAADDLIGFGDTDEIPSRANVQLLKHCEWQNSDPVDVGIWFPFGRIHQAFQTDGPVPGHPYTLGEPTYHVWEHMIAAGHASRNGGRSPNWILGGAHFTHYGYIVYQLLKRMSCSECIDMIKLDLSRLRAAVKTGRWRELEQEMSQPGGFSSRIIPLDQLDPEERRKIVYLPWFYDCNRNRYPMWEGHPDSRTIGLESDGLR
jgi:hypothetical protein